MPLSAIRYPVDPTGRSATHRIVNEPHSITLPDGMVIVPNYSPFYTRDLEVYQEGSATPLQAGEDYVPIEMDLDATMRFEGGEACSAIVIKKKTLGSRFVITYQTVGGSPAANASAVEHMIELLRNDDRPVLWGRILNKPKGFEPLPHRHNANTLYKLDNLLVALERVRQAVLAGDSVKLENMRLWVTNQVDDVKQAQDSFAGRRDNPNQVNKQQVGLGNVANFSTATIRDGIAGERPDLFMTPETTAAAIRANAAAVPVLVDSDFGYWTDPVTGFTHVWGVSPEVNQDEYYHFNFRRPLRRIYSLMINDVQRNIDNTNPSGETSRFDVELSAKVLKRSVSNRGFIARVYRLFGNNETTGAVTGSSRDRVNIMYHAIGIADETLPDATESGRKLTQVKRFDNGSGEGWWSGGLDSHIPDGYNSDSTGPTVISKSAAVNLSFESGPNVGWLLGNTGNTILNASDVQHPYGGAWVARVMPTGTNDEGRLDISRVVSQGTIPVPTEGLGGYYAYSWASYQYRVNAGTLVRGATAGFLAGFESQSQFGADTRDFTVFEQHTTPPIRDVCVSNLESLLVPVKEGVEYGVIQQRALFRNHNKEQSAIKNAVKYMVPTLMGVFRPNGDVKNGFHNQKSDQYFAVTDTNYFLSKFLWRIDRDTVTRINGVSGKNAVEVSYNPRVVANTNNRGVGVSEGIITVQLQPYSRYRIPISTTVNYDTAPSQNQGAYVRCMVRMLDGQEDATRTATIQHTATTQASSSKDGHVDITTDHRGVARIMVRSVLHSSQFVSQTTADVTFGVPSRTGSVFRSVLAQSSQPTQNYSENGRHSTHHYQSTVQGVLMKWKSPSTANRKFFCHRVANSYTGRPVLFKANVTLKRQPNSTRFVGVYLSTTPPDQWDANQVTSLTERPPIRGLGANGETYYVNCVSSFDSDNATYSTTVYLWTEETIKGNVSFYVYADIEDPDGEVTILNTSVEETVSPPWMDIQVNGS